MNYKFIWIKELALIKLHFQVLICLNFYCSDKNSSSLSTYVSACNTFSATRKMKFGRA